MWIKNYKSLFEDEHLKLWLKLSLINSKNWQENVLYLKRRKIERNFIGQQYCFFLIVFFNLFSVYRFARGQQSCISRLIYDTELSRWLLCFLGWYNYEYYFSWHKHNNSNWQNPNVLYGNHYRPLVWTWLHALWNRNNILLLSSLLAVFKSTAYDKI